MRKGEGIQPDAATRGHGDAEIKKSIPFTRRVTVSTTCINLPETIELASPLAKFLDIILLFVLPIRTD